MKGIDYVNSRCKMLQSMIVRVRAHAHLLQSVGQAKKLVSLSLALSQDLIAKARSKIQNLLHP